MEYRESPKAYFQRVLGALATAPNKILSEGSRLPAFLVCDSNPKVHTYINMFENNFKIIRSASLQLV